MGPKLWQVGNIAKWQVSGGGAMRRHTQHLAEQTEPTEHAQSGALSLVLAVLSIIRAPRGPSPRSQREEVGWVMWNMPLQTSVSLHSHQIFTVLYYSGLALWQKCIMWTSCGCHGNIGSYNNCVHRKIEKNTKNLLVINNWKVLILDLSAPQSSGTQTGFVWKRAEMSFKSGIDNNLKKTNQ